MLNFADGTALEHHRARLMVYNYATGGSI